MPVADRPRFPDGYGLPTTTKGMLGWTEVEQRLVDATVYWIATVRPDGRPHVVPRWGVWMDGRLWYDGSPDTVQAHNLAANPHSVVHLENGTEAVMVEGETVVAGDPGPETGARLAEAYAKYRTAGYSPDATSWEGERGQGLFVFTPRRAIAWFSFPKDATRFTFGD